MPAKKQETAESEATQEVVEVVEVTPEATDSDIECTICGKRGGPIQECQICHGHGGVQKRAYTLSEERSGRAPTDDRYGPTGKVGPKVANLPGSFNPYTN